MVKLFFLILFSFTSLKSFGQAACNLPPNRFPVIDQDGLGVCASATAAILMQHNIKGLTGPLSYLQMSIYASSARTNSFFNAQGKSFVDSNSVCDVVNETMNRGFCYAEHFPLDFRNEEDPLQSQQRSIESLGRLLERNQPAMEELRRQARDPAMRNSAIRRMAQILFEGTENCRSPREFLINRMWQRQRNAWNERLNSGTPTQRAAAQTALRRAFNPDGSLTDVAINFTNGYLLPNDILNTLRTDQESGARGAITGVRTQEAKLGEDFSFHINVMDRQALNNPSASPADLRRDYMVVAGCQDLPGVRALTKYLADPDCEIKLSPLPTEILGLATRMINEIALEADPQQAIIAIIAPNCAFQARQSSIDGYRCTFLSTRAVDPSKTPEVLAKTREAVTQELCSGRALGISVCAAFMESATLIRKNVCNETGSGHAMTVVSARTLRDGKRQYLVQNSWGRSCKFNDQNNVLKPAFAGLVECVTDNQGMQTGRFWIDEDFLMSNSQGFYAITSTTLPEPGKSK